MEDDHKLLQNQLTVGRAVLENNGGPAYIIGRNPKIKPVTFKSDNTEVMALLDQISKLNIPQLSERILDFLKMGGNLIEINLVNGPALGANDVRVSLKLSHGFMEFISTISAGEIKDLTSID
jgi:hypothetical protein